MRFSLELKASSDSQAMRSKNKSTPCPADIAEEAVEVHLAEIALNPVSEDGFSYSPQLPSVNCTNFDLPSALEGALVSQVD